MSKRRFVLLATALLAAIFIWQLPTLLKAIPSRYVAAYLPRPVQALAERDHVEKLPTAAAGVDTAALLDISADVESGENGPATLPPPVMNVTRESDLATIPAPIQTPVPSPTPTNTPVPIPAASRLGTISHQFQTWNNCGPATLAMALSYFNLYLTQSDTAAALKPNPEDRNVSPEEMAAYVNDQTELAALVRVNGKLDVLRRLIAGGFPVIVELGLDPPGEYRWMGWYGHYLLVVAYDDSSEEFWVYDSWFGTSEVPGENADREGRRMSYEELEAYWHQFNRTYIALHRPEEAEEVAGIIGSDMDDSTMWRDALAAAQLQVGAHPENAFQWFNLGTIYNALGEYRKAAAAYDQARATGLPWRMLWYQFGPFEAYYQVGRYEDVIMLADVTLNDRPYFEESFYYKGLALAALGNKKEARDNLEKAVRFNPNFTPAAEALDNLLA